MSFALTTEQVRAGTKTVTRRMGWQNLKQGELVRPVLKCMGLKPGERIQAIRGPIRITSVTREPLCAMTADPAYGADECAKEGFGEHPQYRHPSEFVRFFCATHKGCQPDTAVTRIEFEYLPDTP